MEKMEPSWSRVLYHYGKLMSDPPKIKNRTDLWEFPYNLWEFSFGEDINSHVYCSIFHDRQAMETTQMSINRWIKKMLHIHTMKCYSALTKRKSYHMQLHEWSKCSIQWKTLMLSKMSCSWKNRYNIIPLIWCI